MAEIRILPTAAPVRLGRETDYFPGSPVGVQVLHDGRGQLQDGKPEIIRDRMASHATTILGNGRTADGLAQAVSPNRLLTAEDCHLIYQRTPDVRSCIDGIVRRVATNDWAVQSVLDPADELYEAAAEEADSIWTWLSAPTVDDDLFQEVMTATLTDLLKWDAGACELVANDRDPNMVEELVSVRGADVHPSRDSKGRLQGYVQDPTANAGGATKITLNPAQILYLRLFPNNESPEGLPLLESLIFEVAAILRAAEYMSQSLNYNELPPGLLVVAGLAREAQSRFSGDFEAKRGQEFKLRPLFSEREGVVDAKWVEFSRAPRELQIDILAKEIRRVIWRVFGVMPVEQGDTGETPRATAQVQLDVGSSHLLTPIMDLVEAKLNRVVIPRRVSDPNLVGAIEFRWTRTRDLSPGEQRDRATALKTLCEAALMTPNEGRHIIGLPPRDEGDALLLGDRLLADVVFADQEDQAPDALDPLVASRRRFGVTRPRRGASGAPRRPWGYFALYSRRDAPTSRTMPSAWQSPGRFSGARTLDLPDLWDDVESYGAEASAAWQEAKAEVGATIAALYKPSGFASEDRAEVTRRVADTVDRLLLSWSSGTQRIYRNVARNAAERAQRWTRRAVDEARVQTRADRYHQDAMGYLRDGLLTELRNAIGILLVAVSDVRTKSERFDLRALRAAPLVGPDADTALVVAAALSIFDRMKHRIENWSGKLLDLAYGVLTDEVQAGAPTGKAEGIEEAIPGDPVEWWCEWASVSDEGTCDDCDGEAAKGYQRLADLRIRPGNGTRCRSRCRCVLVLWTRAEIDGGRAQSFN